MRKLMLIVLGTVLALIVVATAALYWFFSGDGMRLALEQQATSWLGQTVRVGGARAQIFPRVAVRLNDVRVGDPVRLTLSDVQLATDLRALFRRRIEDASIVISDSRMEMPLPFAIPDGSSDKSEAVSQDGVQVVSIRAISLRDIRMISRGREVLVSADSALEGNRLTLRQFTADSGATSLHVEGEVDLEPRIDARLRAKANKIDLDELLALADAFTPERTAAAGRSASPAARIAARVSAETATAGGVEVKQFATDMEVNGDRVSLSPLTFQMFGGRYQGSLSARLGNRLAVSLQSRLQDLDVAQLAAFGGSPDSITGTLTGAGTFSAQGDDISAILASASGKGTISIVDGTIRRLNLVRTVVLFFGRPAPDSVPASDRFTRIDASFSLARQVFRADTFALQSPDADIVGTGTLTLGNEALDGTLDVSLSEELSAQAGTDLARYTRENNRIVLPARIGGTLSEPRIIINASAAVKRGLRNEIQRRLQGILGR